MLPEQAIHEMNADEEFRTYGSFAKNESSL